MKQSTTNYREFSLGLDCTLEVLESLGVRKVFQQEYEFSLLRKEDRNQCVACDCRLTDGFDFIESRNRHFNANSSKELIEKVSQDRL